MEINSTSPKIGEIEITVIGTGGGYGESLVIHDGTGQWIVIDSCVSPGDNKNLPLEYLNHIGVDLINNVKLIVCTHWHDDHIRGLSEIYNACLSAEISFSPAHDQSKFLFFVSLDSSKCDNKASESSTYEFNTILDILVKRQKQYKRATSDSLLHRTQLDGKSNSIEIFAISPSPSTLDQFDKEISQLITKFGSPESKIIIKKPNAKSVALLFNFGMHRAILGADLEVGNEPDSGWLNILDNLVCIDKNSRSSYFKVPHHGSQNGYHIRVWNELLADNTITTLTPYINSGIPTDEMTDVYRKHSNNLYITSTKESSTKAKKRSHRLKKLIKEFDDIIVSEVKYSHGIIRSRINILDETPLWKVELSGAAVCLSDV